MTLYCRSVLVLNGNGADVAKHCVPAVPTKRYKLNVQKSLVIDKSSVPLCNMLTSC